MFSFSCSNCGKHAPGDFTEEVICRVNGKYRQGKFSPYNISEEGFYFSKITLYDGSIALLESEVRNSGIESFGIATEVYCNGLLETCVDQTDITNHRFCRPVTRL